MITASVGRWFGSWWDGGSLGKWSVVGLPVVGGSVVGRFNKTPHRDIILKQNLVNISVESEDKCPAKCH